MVRMAYFPFLQDRQQCFCPISDEPYLFLPFQAEVNVAVFCELALSFCQLREHKDHPWLHDRTVCLFKQKEVHH